MKTHSPKRVLARVLSEDLRLAHGGHDPRNEDPAPTVEVTYDSNGNANDVTNTGPDGD